MKRGLFILIVTLLLIPAVSATISVTGPTRTEYNIGDTIDISGSIVRQEDFTGYLDFALICSSRTYNLPQKAITLNNGELISFSQLSLPTITASSSMSGSCRLKVELYDSNGDLQESGSSYSFQIDSGLEGTFSADKTQLQLGDTVTVNGNIYKKNGELLDGTAEIYFVHDNDEYLMSFVDVASGTFTYSYQFTSGSEGKYYVTIYARDSYGNEEEFDSIESFTVLDDLNVGLNTNEQSYYPGNMINVYGDVSTVLQGFVTAANVQISLDATTLSTSLADSKYTQDIQIPSEIKSGQHTISVLVMDTYGNQGSSSSTIEVLPLGKNIELSILNRTINPQDTLAVSSVLYDQAGDVMSDYITLRVYDSKNRLVSERELLSEEDVNYQIPQFASPGEWLVKASYTGTAEEQLPITIQESLTVNTIQSLDYFIEGDVLYIRNTGNVRYTNPVEITVDGVDQDYLITKAKNLGVNETVAINMANELPTGKYTLSMPTGYGTVEETILDIQDGKSLSNFTWAYAILIVIFIICLVCLIYLKMRPKKKKEKLDDPALKPAQKSKVKKIKLYDPKNDVKNKKSNLNFETKEQGLEDFKARTLEEIKRTEEKIKRDSQKSASLGSGRLGYVTGKSDSAPRKNTEDKPSTFNLFDE